MSPWWTLRLTPRVNPWGNQQHEEKERDKEHRSVMSVSHCCYLLIVKFLASLHYGRGDGSTLYVAPGVYPTQSRSVKAPRLACTDTFDQLVAEIYDR